MKAPTQVIVPTRSSPEDMNQLVEWIMETAGVPTLVHVTGRNTSAAINRNAGLDLAGLAEVVAMVDDDVEFPEYGWLRIMLAALARPEVVMVSAQLYKPDGQPAYMTGLQDWGGKPKFEGETVVPTRQLLTACCAFKPHGIRFDEGYVGSGFEDVDYCNRLSVARPDGVFLICHEAAAIHRNEAKNQNGRWWTKNKARYEDQWGPLDTPQELLDRWRHLT